MLRFTEFEFTVRNYHRGFRDRQLLCLDKCESAVRNEYRECCAQLFCLDKREFAICDKYRG
ncbi:hypothetical protein FACS1894204_04240 [Synergistales bacterium]|nr:hypothetical protein FACS1894204_04240 [Synergistales bacterium]